MKKLQIIAVFFIIPFIPFLITAQTWETVSQIGGIKDEAIGGLIPWNNKTFVAGTFEEILELGSLELSSSGKDDFFLSLFNENGDVEWLVGGGGGNDEEVAGITVSGEGDVYLTGNYAQQATFDTLAFEATAGTKAIFLLKYDNAGNLLFGKNIVGTALKSASALDLDSEGNLYLSGFFEDSLWIADTMLSAPGRRDLFLAKYSPPGDFLWVRQAGLEKDVRPTSMKVDFEDYIVIVGNIKGKLEVGGDVVETASPDFDGFLVKFDSAGNGLWARHAGGVFEDNVKSVDVDESGNIYLTGHFVGVISLDGQLEIQTEGFNENFFFIKYSALGEPLIARSLGSTDLEFGRSIAVQGNWVVIGGYFRGEMSIDGITAHTDDSLFNGFLAGFDLDGNARWIEVVSGNDLLLVEEVGFTDQQQVLVGGNFLAQAFFDDETFFSTGGYDIYSGYLNRSLTGNVEIDSDPEFSVFPNPVHDYLNIIGGGEDFEWKIYSLTGVLQKSGFGGGEVYFGNLAPGIYWFFVFRESTPGVRIFKIIKIYK